MQLEHQRRRVAESGETLLEAVELLDTRRGDRAAGRESFTAAAFDARGARFKPFHLVTHRRDRRRIQRGAEDQQADTDDAGSADIRREFMQPRDQLRIHWITHVACNPNRNGERPDSCRSSCSARYTSPSEGCFWRRSM